MFSLHLYLLLFLFWLSSYVAGWDWEGEHEWHSNNHWDWVVKYNDCLALGSYFLLCAWWLSVWPEKEYKDSIGKPNLTALLNNFLLFSLPSLTFFSKIVMDYFQTPHQSYKIHCVKSVTIVFIRCLDGAEMTFGDTERQCTDDVCYNDDQRQLWILPRTSVERWGWCKKWQKFHLLTVFNYFYKDKSFVATTLTRCCA